ncbi:MAG: hypothetical protein IPL34_20465 [Thiofilum sp.]|uniref:hypothetical protein n=1 Tax=Thiofilum sp. TaxID=2212733 RepID=UPI0025DF674A|nr:hypothetical protein [Thiofilum sp.]MBK8455657.1 hypothetical protein [Thiofilum sp.]
MARYRSIKNALFGGEISNQARGRTDLAVYAQSCDNLENVLPLPAGGVYKRPGTRYQHLFSAPQGNNVITRIVYNKKNNKFVYFYMSGYDGKIKLRYIRWIDVSGRYEFSVETDLQTATGNTSLNYFLLESMQSVETTFGTVICNGASMPLVVDWYTKEMYIDAGDITPNVVRMNRVPFLYTNVSTGADNTYVIRPFISLIGGPYRISQNDYSPLKIEVGSIFKAWNGAAWGYYKAKAINMNGGSYYYASCDLIAGSAPATDYSTLSWAHCAWSPYYGYPRTCTIFANRLIFGGTDKNPNSIYISSDGDTSVMSREDITDPELATLSPLYPFTLTSKYTDSTEHHWSNNSTDLIFGSKEFEYLYPLKDATLGFQPGNVNCLQVSRNGSAVMGSVRAGGEIVFLGKDGSSFNGFTYNDTEKSWKVQNLNTFFSEFPSSSAYSSGLTTRLIDATYDSSRKTMWCVDDLGKVAALTRDKDFGLSMWTRHILGTSGATWTSGIDQNMWYDGRVMNIIAINGSVYFVVIRWNYDTGAFNYVFEVLDDGKFAPKGINKFDFYSAALLDCHVIGNHVTDIVEPIFFDLEVVYNDATPLGHTHCLSTDIIPYGISYTYDSVADDDRYQVLNPQNNVVFFNVSGFNYTSIIKPVRMEVASPAGSSQGSICKHHKLMVRFDHTMACKIGEALTRLREINFNTSTQLLSESAPVYSGELILQPEFSYSIDRDVYFVSDSPLPLGVVAIVTEGVQFDG